MITKKGISIIIGWILLLGFTITLALLVFSWSKSQAESLSEETATFVEGRLECTEIAINVVPNDDCSSINVNNRGKLNIDQLVILTFVGTDYDSKIEYKEIIAPKETKTLNLQKSHNKLEIVPSVKINNKLIPCNENRIVNEC
tara:strand:+ start:60311 stop:60739 length:429 start_codon:yes stop_codon:yes gene_type:complete